MKVRWKTILSREGTAFSIGGRALSSAGDRSNTACLRNSQRPSGQHHVGENWGEDEARGVGRPQGSALCAVEALTGFDHV